MSEIWCRGMLWHCSIFPQMSRLLICLPSRCVEKNSSTFVACLGSWRMSLSPRESVDDGSFVRHQWTLRDIQREVDGLSRTPREMTLDSQGH